MEGPSWSTVQFLGVIIYLQLCCAVQDTKITYITPKLGSSAGGTKITINGVGFSKNQFNFGAGNEHLGNSVKLVSDTKQFDCPIHVDGSHERQIQCITEPMPKDYYFIRVFVDGQPVPLPNHCNHNEAKSSNCRFQSYIWSTPTIEYITPNEGPPGTIVDIRGILYTIRFTTNEDSSPNGKSELIRRVYNGGQLCKLIKDNSVDDEFYGRKLDSEKSSWGNLKCKMGGTYVGNHNMSFIVDGAYGRSEQKLGSMKVMASNKIGMFQTYALVSSVSPSSGSVEGGTLLTINGNHFDESDAKALVTVGGDTCAVKTLSDTKITCKMPPKPLAASHLGPRGWTCKIWKGQHKADRETFDFNQEPDNTTWSSDARFSDPHTVNKFDNCLIQCKGFFVPAEDNDYRFYLEADDLAELYLTVDTAGNDISRTKVLTAELKKNKYSDTYSLKAGKAYPVEALLVEYTSTALLKLGAKMLKTAFTAQYSSSVHDEKQQIMTWSKFEPEIQSLSIENWKEGSGKAEVQDVQILADKDMDIAGAQFRLGAHGVYSSVLSGDSLGTDVADALNDLPFFQQEKVTATKESISVGGLSGVKLTITFPNGRGDFPDLKVIKDPKSPVGITHTTSETTKGVPSGQFFQIEYKGVPSMNLIAYSSLDAKKLAESVEEMFSVRCPQSFVQPQGVNVMFRQTYEPDSKAIGNEYGTRSNTVEPFCGRYSSEKPKMLFEQNKDGMPMIDLAKYPYMCYAHLGEVKEYMYIKHEYKRNSETIVRQSAYHAHHTGKYKNLKDDNGKDVWSYQCLDMMEPIKAKHGEDISKVFIMRVDVPPAVNPNNDIYFDEVTFSAKPLTEDIEGITKYRRMRPHKFTLGDVTVEGENGNFNISMDMTDCDHNLGFITVAHSAVQSSDASSTTNSYMSGSTITTSRVNPASPPVTGTFDITYNGKTVRNIPADITDDELKAKLEETFDDGQLLVSRDGTCAAYTWTVEWKTKGGKKLDIEVDNSKIKGLNATVTWKRAQMGGVLRNPIPGDMLAEDKGSPQVRVLINKIASACTGDCSYAWSDSATPTISGITPSSGSLSDATILTITGSGFDSTDDNNKIIIGGESCNVTASTSTEIKCTIGRGPVGEHNVDLFVDGKGKASHSGGPHEFTYLFTASGISPTSGSLGGGVLLTISGAGFGKGVTVTVGGKDCNIESVNYDQIVCKTPKADTAGAVDVVITQAARRRKRSTTTVGQFTYSNALTPTITKLQMSAASATVLGGTTLTITGTGFGASAGKNMITLGGKAVTINSYSDTEVQVTLPALGPGAYTVAFDIDGQGQAKTDQVADINYVCEVTKVFPEYGSQAGGTVVTIKGSGFSTTCKNNEVKFGTTECEVKSCTADQILCETKSAGKTHVVENTGKHMSWGDGYAWEPTNLQVEVGDTVHWKWSTPEFVSGKVFKIEQTDTATSIEAKETGFTSNGPSTANGEFIYKVTAPGTYYYWSGFTNGDSRPVRGTINSSNRNSTAQAVSVKVNGFEALHKTSSGVADPVDGSSCPGETKLPSGCFSPSGEDDKLFYFATISCLTAEVNSISPQTGNTDEDIIITGTGFSSTKCQNQVKFGGFTCDVSSATSTKITCRLNSIDGALPVEKLLDLELNINNFGNAINTEIKNTLRGYQIMPYVSSFSPEKGSTLGGAELEISGSGLCNSCANDKCNVDAVAVYVGTIPCKVTCATYAKVTCTTGASNVDTSLNVTVYVNSNGKTLESTCSSGSCLFAYETASTPSVTGIQPTTIAAENTVLTITGTALDGTKSIKIGTTVCTSVTAKSTEVTCNAGAPIVGSQPVSVVTSSGSASFKPTSLATITVSPKLTTIQPAVGSVVGSTSVTMTGFGFATSEETTVSIGGSSCKIDTITSTSLVCTTSAHAAEVAAITLTSKSVAFPTQNFEYSDAATPTVTSVSPESGLAGDTLTLSGTNFGNTAGDLTVKVGDAACTAVSASDTSATCTLGAHPAGQFNVAVVVSGRGAAQSTVKFTYTLQVTSVSPSTGSMAGGQIITITGKGFDDKTNFTVCDVDCVATEAVTATTYKCKTASNSGTGTVSCEIKATGSEAESTLPGSYTYDSSLTAEVTGVSPARGGTGGGTTLTISGTGFGTNPSNVKVTIGGVTCVVSTVTNTQVVCVTGSRSPSIKTKVEVDISGNGIAKQSKAGFEYIDLWSSKFTWGGKEENIPKAGDFVVIPKEMTILLDVDTPTLSMLLIQGGKLIFDEKDIELKSEYILIVGGGLLQVGTEEAPFEHKGIITMVGHPRAKELPIYGAKVIGVREGTLDLHGKHIGLTWTLLAQTANAGTKTLVLQQSVNWKVGDEIALATTGHRHSQSENEKAKIAAISGDGLTITLEENLKHTHLGETVTVDGVSFEARGEVGLLTHNVVVRGSNNLEWADKIEPCAEGFNTGEFTTQTCFQGRFGEEIGTDQYGAQILIHGPYLDSGLVKARIENVEFTYVGQAFRLGRYAVHFHLNGDMDGSYVKSCGTHQSFNRAVNIHGTHNILIERNVLFNIMGGAFFLEDGIETGNVIRYNLAIMVIQSTSLQNDDITPAAYWVTNPNNTYEHNHAAGGTHFGFWYRMHEHPDAASFDPNICPRKVPMGRFFNNTVHSQGWFGVWIFRKWNPTTSGGCKDNNPEAAIFDTLIAWNNEKGFESVETGSIQVWNSVFANNEKAGVEIKQLIQPIDHTDDTKTCLVKNTKIISHFAGGVLSSPKTRRAIILPPSRGQIVRDTSFYNFEDGAVFDIAQIDGKVVSFFGGFTAHVSGAYFFNTAKRAAFKWENAFVIDDQDGSVSGTGKPQKILPDTGTLPDTCTADTNNYFNGNANVPGRICPGSLNFHRISWNKFAPKSLEGQDVFFTNEYGVTTAKYHKKRMTHAKGWMAILPSGYAEVSTFVMQYDYAYHITNHSYQGVVYDLKPSDNLVIQQNFTQTPDMVSITGDTRPKSNKTVSCKTNKNGDWWLADDDSNIVRYAICPDENKAFVDRPLNLRVYRCFYDNCEVPLSPGEEPVSNTRPPNAKKWSDYASWNDGKAPTSGDDIVIPDGEWIVLDEEDVTVNKITVEGVLEFEYLPKPASRRRRREVSDTKYYNFILRTTHLIVTGGSKVIIGTEENPFLGTAEIRLLGDHYTKDFPVQNGPNVGSKAIGVFGGLEIHGAPRALTWTRIASSVAAGDTTLTVVDAASDWAVGEEIVIASTSYNSSEAEKRKITAISANKKTITVDSAFKFKHIAVSETVDGKSYTMAAEVGLLSRNIKIIGESYAKQDEEAFGARVLVAAATALDGREYSGYARLSNVEFYHSGQEGYTDYYDPRHSVSYMDVGDATKDSSPSYVKNCAFHDGYGSTIGVYGQTSNMVIENNVAHRSVGSAMIDYATNTTWKNNLVVHMVHPGTYADRKVLQLIWESGFEVNNAKEPMLIDNVVAGTERGAFRIDGQPCATLDKWSNNQGHSGLYGAFLLPNPYADGISPCTLVTGFFLWKFKDVGIYVQTSNDVEVRDNVVMDSTIGLYPNIYGPSATGHQYANRTFIASSNVFAGSSAATDCTNDALDMSEQNMVDSGLGRGKTHGGKVGTTWPTFASANNKAPSKPFVNIMAYNAIMGVMYLTGNTYANYGSGCDGKKDIAVAGDKTNDDLQHPILMKETKLISVTNKVFLPRPNTGKINPADCVDMDCDGLKKNLLVDEDGSFLGKPGVVFSESEFEWDVNPVRGLGDYRIPKSMLTSLDGSRIDPPSNKGIIRDKSCTKEADWQAWTCPMTNYFMMQIESMDHDTETRRVSPVALASGDYIDLVNGPQDHGWCSGYTCQKRLSLFPFLVQSGLNYSLHFSGTTPQNLRLFLLNSEDTDAVTIGIWFAASWRLDVYNSGNYILPTNGKLDENKQLILSDIEAIPDPASNLPSGTNFYDRKEQVLHVLIRGSGPIEIKTNKVVIVTFGVPTQTIDEFFGEKIITNLAAFLNIPKERIKIPKIVSEKSRKKRNAVSQVQVEISNPPKNEGEAASAGAISDDKMYSIAGTIIETFQSGKLADVLQVPQVLGMTIVEPPPPTNSNSWNNIAKQDLPPQVTIQIPNSMHMHKNVGSAKAGVKFASQPVVKVKDISGSVINQLGSTMEPWKLQARLKRISGSASAYAGGTTAVDYLNGAFTFTDLFVSHAGTFVFEFDVISPNAASSFQVTSAQFTVTGTSESGSGSSGSSGGSGGSGTDSGDKDWTCTVSLHLPELYHGQLEKQPAKVTYNPITKQATFSDLKISKPGQYFLKYDCVTPTGSKQQFVGSAMNIHSTGFIKPKPEVLKKIKLRFNANYTQAVKGQENYFAAMLYNRYYDETKNVTFGDFKISEGSIIAEFIIAGSSISVNAMIEYISEDSKTMQLNFLGNSVPSSGEMWVDNEKFYGTNKSAGLHPGVIAAIVIVCLLVVAGVVVAVVLIATNKCKVTGHKSSNLVSCSQQSLQNNDVGKSTNSIRSLGRAKSKISSPSTSDTRSVSSDNSSSAGSDKPLVGEDKSKKTTYAVNKQVGNAGKSPTKSVVSVRSASKTSLSGKIPQAPSREDLYSAGSAAQSPVPSLARLLRQEQSSTSLQKSNTSLSSVPASTAVYGNARALSPNDEGMSIKFDSQVSIGRPNGPMVSTNMRRDSHMIPVDYKMPGAE